MDPACEMCDFLAKPQPNEILSSTHWVVGVINEQSYLGRAIAGLKTHKSSLSELSSEEWADFQEIVRKLEPAYQKAFGATPLNWGCFMNHAFREDPPHPHVHWHIFPRYKEKVIVNGLEFTDSLYGNFYDDKANRTVDEQTLTEITRTLKAQLG